MLFTCTSPDTNLPTTKQRAHPRPAQHLADEPLHPIEQFWVWTGPFAAIQTVDSRHLGRAQVKVEQLEVLPHPVRVHGLGKDDVATLNCPPQSDLRWRALVRLRNLLDHRSWLAGSTMSLADIAAAAHISVADYLGGIDWTGHEPVKRWYAGFKSRPSFRPLLSERMEAIVPPPYYDKPDF